jgi:hypothetical protein
MSEGLFLAISTYHAKQQYLTYQNIWPVLYALNAFSSHNIVVEFHKFIMLLHANDLADFHTLKIQRNKLGIDKVAEI